MLELYLTAASISYLTQFILALVITAYLVVRFVRHRRQLSPQNGYLLTFFSFFTVLLLLFFLEYSLLPSARLFYFNLQNSMVAITLAALIQFAYHFPAPNAQQKIERRLVLLLSGGYFLWELGIAFGLQSQLGQGRVAYRPDYLQYAMIVEFAWVVFVFTRNALQNRDLPASRNFALILLIPFGVAFLTYFQNSNAIITNLFPIISSIAILLTIFLFATNYLSCQPERVSFVVKISGIVLASVLTVFGIIPWLITSAYTAQYTSPILSLERRTIHFQPNSTGGYLAQEIPFRWENELGERIPYPAINQVSGYDFNFSFFGQEYDRVFVSSMGAIGMGEMFVEADFQINFTSRPMLIPLLVCKGASNDPEAGEFFRSESGKAVITWNKVLSCTNAYAPPEQTYSYQVVLYEDGSFDFSYNGLPPLEFSANARHDTVAWAIGIKPATAPTGTATFAHLPVQVSPQGALQDEYRSFRLYLHQFLAPIAIAVLASSMFFLIGAILILKYGLARPLNTLLEGIQQLNQGQSAARLPIQSNDEIGFLTESFNNLGGELNSLIHELEARVARRTQELAIANAQLLSEMEAREAAQAQAIEHQRAVATLEERERLARDLHDGIGQVLGFFNVQTQSAHHSLQTGNHETASQQLERMAEVAREAHGDVRGYILGIKKEPSTAPRQNFFHQLEQYSQHLVDNFAFQTTLNLPAERQFPIASGAIENQLLYVIREALSNARAHSGQNAAEVTIILDEQLVQAVIEDHGKGFSEHGKNGHFGLGIMRERVKQVGGSLEIESAPGAGTRVTLSLPRQPGAESTPTRRVLLVDDHPLFLEGMTNLVQGRGMSIVGTANDGLEAQEKARQLRPDVVLMDIEMPRCNGLEAARLIKTEMPEVKIVMLTVSGEEQHLFEALQGGASGYLLKSLDAAELTSLLDELLRGEVSLSPNLASRMLEAFTRHKSPPAQSPCLHPEPTPPPELSARQTDILCRVAQGETYKEIGGQLGLAEVTIKYHMGEILARLHLHTRREAVEYYQQRRKA